ncbi:urea transporter [Streptomyces sp. ZAF1911]|uniref:urea transporter n=1 Tax=Streptomyces sp. ZAF1911 TaxID=2944129 RepID=UPI00237BC8A9|nr:urea transporter [Streptomyces sp. ZAF1911]MDD9380580.1 urea transporter [Streptomyces sp. ZAF1911]
MQALATEPARQAPPAQPASFIQEVLRGVAQVDFMPSAITGIFFLAALAAAGWQYALYGLLGAVVGTGTAYAFGIDREIVSAGLRGFNGTLVSLGFAVFLGWDHLSTLLLAIGGSVTVVVVTSALATVLGTWNIPTFTAPFCIIASVMTIAAPSFSRVWHTGPDLAALPAAANGTTALDWGQLWRAFFANVGQIFFMPQWYVGLIFLAGIFVASRVAGVMACVGSVTAIFVAWAMGSPSEGVSQGLMGYSSVLVAMALCGVFVVPSRWSFAFAVLGAAAATGLTAAMTAFFAPFGGHTFTWPFVLTTVVFVAAVPQIPRLQRT